MPLDADAAMMPLRRHYADTPLRCRRRLLVYAYADSHAAMILFYLLLTFTLYYY